MLQEKESIGHPAGLPVRSQAALEIPGGLVIDPPKPDRLQLHITSAGTILWLGLPERMKFDELPGSRRLFRGAHPELMTFGRYQRASSRRLQPQALHLLARVVGRTDQRAGLDVPEAQREPDLAELGKLLRRVVPPDRSMVGRGA